MPRRKSNLPAKKGSVAARQTAEYRHTEETPARPDVGTQPQFKKRAAPKTYRYDSSLAPALDWDGQNPEREQGEALIAELEMRIRGLRAALAQEVSPSPQPSPRKKTIPSPLMEEGEGGGEETRRLLDEAEEALRKLKALSKPFLNWAGKAERLSFDVPTLPLFIHERLSTRAILETLKGHKRDKQLDLFDLFSDPQRPIHDQVLRAYLIDTHPTTQAFVKNAGLGFAIPYVHNGETHEYVPDFIVRLIGQGERHLIVEVKGFDELEEVKRAAAHRWVDAVNAEGSFGRWGYVVAKGISRVRDLISAAAA